ncbi:MAG: hypothetical protein WC881_11260 [Elusimicrobiota bacterium]|jgi:hypothetical protein
MKFWIYVNGEVPGCFTVSELAAIPGFSSTTLVCPAEGEILEKNWRRAGEFPDIMPALQELARKQQPPPPPEAPAPADVDKLLDSASHRLFSHVADLMKELEGRREEKALVLSLQRQILDLKGQLQEARESCAQMESRMPRILELEQAQRQSDDHIHALEASLKGRDKAVAEQRVQLEKAKTDLENAKRRLSETANDLAIRNRLVDKLSRDLTEKEVNLAKALGIIRRLEEDLNRICPESISEAARQQIESLSAPAQDKAKETAPKAQSKQPTEELRAKPLTFTTDEPAQLPEVVPPPIQPSQQPAAQNALVDFLKQFINNKQA